MPGQAPARPHVQMVQRARAHLDQHLVGAHTRFRALLVPEDFRPAVLVEDDCFHVFDFRFLSREWEVIAVCIRMRPPRVNTGQNHPR